jgi:hypothetical protein
VVTNYLRAAFGGAARSGKPDLADLRTAFAVLRRPAKPDLAGRRVEPGLLEQRLVLGLFHAREHHL